MRRKQRKKTTNNSNTLIYISGGILLVAVIAFVIAFVVYSSKLNLDTPEIIDTELFASTEQNRIMENTASASSSVGKTVEESKKELNNNTSSDTNEIKEKEKTTEKKSNTNSSESKKANNKKEEKEPKFVSPIESSEILREYAKDNLVYSETLKEWITHLGIDVKAEKATVVKASAEGTVKSIKNDPRYGLTIIIEHSAGYQTLYANLLTTEFVSEGEKVKAGQTIGTVGDTAVYEVVDEPHLHFEIIRKGENVNPAELIKF